VGQGTQRRVYEVFVPEGVVESRPLSPFITIPFICEVVSLLPLGATRRAWKREATRLIAGRGVSQQQARSDKRTMLRLAEGEPVVEGAVQEILSGAFVSRGNSANRYVVGSESEVLPDSVPIIASGPKDFQYAVREEHVRERNLQMVRRTSDWEPGLAQR